MRPNPRFPAALFLLAAGCLSNPPRKAYLAEYEPVPAAATDGAAGPALAVGPFAAAEPYGAARMLVWEEATGRLHGTQGAEWATPPAVALRNGVRRALAASGAFGPVVDGDVPGARSGASVGGYVEKARLERRADGSLVYAVAATFRHRTARDAPPRTLSLAAEVPAADATPEAQAAAARTAYADLCRRLADAL